MSWLTEMTAAERRRMGATKAGRDEMHAEFMRGISPPRVRMYDPTPVDPAVIVPIRMNPPKRVR